MARSVDVSDLTQVGGEAHEASARVTSSAISRGPSIGELAAAVEAELPVAVVIWNNHGYDMIARNFRDAGMEPVACDIYTPDLLQIAAGYGCHAERAGSLAEFKDVLQSAPGRKVPTVIEVLETDFIDSTD